MKLGKSLLRVDPHYYPSYWVVPRLLDLLPGHRGVNYLLGWFEEYVKRDKDGTIKMEVYPPREDDVPVWSKETLEAVQQRVDQTWAEYEERFRTQAQACVEVCLDKLEARGVRAQTILVPSSWPRLLETEIRGATVWGPGPHSFVGAFSSPEEGLWQLLELDEEAWAWNPDPYKIIGVGVDEWQT